MITNLSISVLVITKAPFSQTPEALRCFALDQTTKIANQRVSIVFPTCTNVFLLAEIHQDRENSPKNETCLIFWHWTALETGNSEDRVGNVLPT